MEKYILIWFYCYKNRINKNKNRFTLIFFEFTIILFCYIFLPSNDILMFFNELHIYEDIYIYENMMYKYIFYYYDETIFG